MPVAPDEMDGSFRFCCDMLSSLSIGVMLYLLAVRDIGEGECELRPEVILLIGEVFPLL
jgi:hypothetical protein